MTRRDLLIEAGVYVVVRRFSSKEERKRIVASLLEPSRLPSGVEWIGIENHLNYFHCSGRGLSRPLAVGVTAYLNWTVVDDIFGISTDIHRSTPPISAAFRFLLRTGLSRSGGISFRAFQLRRNLMRLSKPTV